MSFAALSWLCNCLQEKFNINSDIDAKSISKEKEKDILVTLARACRHLRDLGVVYEYESGANNPIDNMYNLTFCRHEQSAKAHCCMEMVTETLVVLLIMKNDFISHSAGKTLLVLSNYLVESVSKWKSFLHLLWTCLKGVCFHLEANLLCDKENSFDSYPVDSICPSTGTIDTRVAYYIRYLTKANWCSNLPVGSTRLKRSCIAASRLMELLRNILKTCQFKSDECGDVYLHIADTYIVDVAWVLLHKLSLEETDSTLNSSSEIHPLSVGNRRHHYVETELVLGSLLQILCSLVHVISSKNGEGEGANLLSQWPMIAKINELIPALSIQALALHSHPQHDCISDFLRHKLLMLMIRISDYFLQKPCTFVPWLDLLWKHATDLLGYSLPERKIHEIPLAGSPFWTSLYHCNKDSTIYKSHLQSRAVYLLFKCSLNLIKNDLKGPKGVCSFDDSHLASEYKRTASQLNLKVESGGQRAVAVLKDWLLRQISCVSDFTDDVFINRCNKFTSAFLQLFMDEDDLMFEMLLQLLNIPVPLQLVLSGGDDIFDKKTCMEACIEALEPHLLFYELLAGIQYDHSVLVDYLISKSTGILCLRYLLRCLRVVCDSWPDSVKFSPGMGDPSVSGNKRRRHQLALKEPLERHQSSILEISSLSTSASDSSQISVPCKDELELGQILCKRKGVVQLSPMSMIINDDLRFENVQRCLSSLHDAIENLHNKGLFPYNPSPLLKRLRKFLQLCNETSAD